MSFMDIYFWGSVALLLAGLGIWIRLQAGRDTTDDADESTASSSTGCDQ